MVTARKPGTAKVEAERKSVGTKATASIRPVAKKVPATKPVAAKPVAVKGSTAKKTVAKVTPAKTLPVTPAKAPAAKKAMPARPLARELLVNPEQRAHYVQVAAFYIAERRGFVAGNPMEDWLAAEAEVDRLIASGHLSQ